MNIRNTHIYTCLATEYMYINIYITYVYICLYTYIPKEYSPYNIYVYFLARYNQASSN